MPAAQAPTVRWSSYNGIKQASKRQMLI